MIDRLNKGPSTELNGFIQAFAHATVGVAICDLSGKFIQINDALCRITGYSRQELSSLDVLSITHPTYRAANANFMRRLLAGDVPAFVLEKPNIRKGGNVGWVQDSVSLWRDARGNPVSIVAICEDISDRNTVQSALLESEERFRLEFKNTPIPIFSWRRTGDDFTLVDYNDAADRITAHGIEDLLGRKASELFAKTPEVIEGLESCFHGKQLIRKIGDFRFLSTGVMKHLDVSFIWVPPDLVMIHTQDITDRERAYEARAEAERKYRDIFENANEGIYQTTPEGRFLTANPALARIFGFDCAEELISQRTDLALQHYVDSGRRSEFKNLLEQEGAVRGFEYEAYHRDGRRIWISTSVRSVRDEYGTILYYEGIAEDITERRLTENALRNQKEVLQKIFDHIPVMINFIDEKGDVKLINQEWERRIGWTLEEIVAGKIDVLAETYPEPSERAKVMDLLAKARGEWVDFKTRARDGRIIDTSWATVHLSEGTTIGIGKDITQQKRNAQLSEAASTLAHGLSGARSPLEVANTIVKIADDLFGWDSCTLVLYDHDKDTIDPVLTIDTIDGKRQDVTPFPVETRVTPLYRRVINKGAELTSRQRPVAPNGSGVPFSPHARQFVKTMTVPIRHGEHVIGVLSIQSYAEHSYTEISLAGLHSLADLCGGALDRIRAEQRLSESEERFRQIAENIDEVIWMVDLSLNSVLYLNPAFERIWGRSTDSINTLLKSIMDTVHPDDRPKAELMLDQLARGRYQNFEYRIIRPDGTIRWIRNRPFPIWDAEGKAYRVAGVAEDITQRKTSELELRRYSRRLIEAQESERKHIARELHDEIGQLLTAVKINLQGLEQSCADSKIENQIKEDICVVDEALQRARDLSFELRPSLLDDLGLAAATRWYVDRYAKRAGIKAEVTIDPEILEEKLPRDVATACFRILQEALTNVARHAQAQHVFIKLESIKTRLVMSVKDDGVGMETTALQNGASQSSTLGLRGMEERALAVAGYLQVVSILAEGTEIRAIFPIGYSSNKSGFALTRDSANASTFN